MLEAIEAVEAEAEEVEDNSPTKDPGGVQSIQIFQLETGRGAECIISSGNKPFSAQTQPTVPGKTFTLQSQPNNERLTSSANINKLTQYTQCCIMKKV